MIYEKINLRESVKEGSIPTLTAYVLDDPLEQNKKRPAVLVCPGGGYAFCSPREAEPIAIKYNSFGFNAFVVNYSVAPSKYPDPMIDASNALKLIRENADRWNVIPDKVAACGFSAGGHLAASLGTLFNTEPVLDMGGLNRPDAMVLCYPVITSGEFAHDGSFDNLCGDDLDLRRRMSLETRVTKDTPPTFLWHTYSDDLVPVENSMMFASALRKHDIPFELHIYHDGPHGLSLANTEVQWDKCYPHLQDWIDLSADWLLEVFEIPKM